MAKPVAAARKHTKATLFHLDSFSHERKGHVRSIPKSGRAPQSEKPTVMEKLLYDNTSPVPNSLDVFYLGMVIPSVGRHMSNVS